MSTATIIVIVSTLLPTSYNQSRVFSSPHAQEALRDFGCKQETLNRLSGSMITAGTLITTLSYFSLNEELRDGTLNLLWGTFLVAGTIIAVTSFRAANAAGKVCDLGAGVSQRPKTKSSRVRKKAIVPQRPPRMQNSCERFTKQNLFKISRALDDRKESLKLFLEACACDNPYGCAGAGAILQEQNKADNAQRHYRRACELGLQKACKKAEHPEP